MMNREEQQKQETLYSSDLESNGHRKTTTAPQTTAPTATTTTTSPQKAAASSNKQKVAFATTTTTTTRNSSTIILSASSSPLCTSATGPPLIRRTQTPTSYVTGAQFPGAVYVRGLAGASDEEDDGTIVIGGYDNDEDDTTTTQDASILQASIQTHCSHIRTPQPPTTSRLPSIAITTAASDDDENPFTDNDDDDDDKPSLFKQHQRRLWIMGIAIILFLGVFIYGVIKFFGNDNNDTMSSSSQFVPTSPSPTSSFAPSLAPTTLEWVLSSEIIAPTSDSDSFGYNVDFNDMGTRIAISSPYAHDTKGQVNVYERKENEEWIKMGNNDNILMGDDVGDYASYGMDLSGSGNVLAIGYPGNGNGFVRVFEYTSSTPEGWKQKGQTIAGDEELEWFGSSVALNKNGTILVIGSPLSGQGMFQAYKWNKFTNEWLKYGNAIYGQYSGDHFATSLSINNIGNRILVGIPHDDTKWDNGGRIILYGYNVSTTTSTSSLHNNGEEQEQNHNDDDECTIYGNCWIDMSSSFDSNENNNVIVGDNENDQLGHVVAMTSDSEYFVTSSITYNEDVICNGSLLTTEEEENQHNQNVGKVQVYHYDDEVAKTNPVGLETTGGNSNESNIVGLGYHVDIYRNGTLLFFSTTSLNHNDDTGIGQVYAFDGSSNSFQQIGKNIGGELSLPTDSTWMGRGIGNTEGTSSSTGPSITMTMKQHSSNDNINNNPIGNLMIAMGYQSVVMSKENGQQVVVPGLVRIYRLEAVK